LDSLQNHIFQPSRKLKVTYSLEKAVNMKVIHGADAEKQMIDILTKEIEDEINKDLIKHLMENINAQNSL
jgi:hypothetical protein